MEDINSQQGDAEDEESPTGVHSPTKRHFSVFSGKANSSANSDKESCPVHVVTRVRPLNPQEIERKDNDVIEFAGNGALFVQSGKSTSFGFDAVFEKECGQDDVFQFCDIKRLLDMAVDGYACTAFAFGQTGSGKTYTMTGPVTPESASNQGGSLREPDNYGLIQFSFSHLMQRVNGHDVTTVKASYMEIYNEQVQDLLNPFSHNNVQVRWAKGSGFYVENLLTREIEDLDDLMDVLEEGMKNRSVAAHNMNEHSSRSHSILTVYIDSEGVEEGIVSVTKHGKISFVDLAGSEKVKETGSTGDTLTEATNINRSLLTLGNCISALSDTKKRGGHIPFRDSKLTKLLADSLGGQGATLMIACISPSAHNVSETLNTLRYAKRAKKIQNKPTIKMDPREELILKLQREMHLIKKENLLLRDHLQFPQRANPRFPQPGQAQDGHRMARFLPEISRANERPTTENSLYEMLQEYMVENESLRNQNQSLASQHSRDERDRRIISRENDLLSDKLEEMQRLVLSSPLFRNSRTNSGHSFMSIQSYEGGSTFTPISQTFARNRPGVGPNSFPNYAIRDMQQEAVLRHQYQPRQAWESTQYDNGELPPVRGPRPRKQPVQSKMIRQNPARSKWSVRQTYAKQLQDKKAWHRINNDATHKKPPDDVMKDFPLRDLAIPRRHPQRFKSSGPNPPRLAVLPNEAYQARDVSPRGPMKELSATSLRRMNKKIRREMRDLDVRIHDERSQRMPEPR